jgi:putative Flp pilus-assembly TadE/G-like protein
MEGKAMRLIDTQRRRGTVVVAVGVCLVAMLGVIALSLDGGLLLDKRRQAQAAADAAALAGGSELFRTIFTNGGLDNGPLPTKTGPAAGTIRAFCKEVAKRNGFEDGEDGVTVEVYIPPMSGPFTGQPGHVEVKISCHQRRFFSRVFGPTEEIPIGARAVARGKRNTVNNGIIVLNPTEKGSFQTAGGGSVTVAGTASVIVDSNNTEAMIANGGGTVTAPYYDVTGTPGWSTPGGGSFTGTINSGVEPTPDPLRFIPEPDPTTLITRSTKRLTHSSASKLTLKPGLYEGGIAISGKGSIVLEPGLYYMRGGFSFTGQGSLYGVGVTIFNYPMSTSDAVDLQGQGAITLTPPMDGPYQGITLFQARTSTYQPTVSVTGTGSAPLYMTGTFYSPEATLKVTGNGTEDTIGSQYISDKLVLGGNGSFNVNWDPTLVPGIRQVWLVE